MLIGELFLHVVWLVRSGTCVIARLSKICVIGDEGAGLVCT
jgi:hypothetical protein